MWGFLTYYLQITDRMKKYSIYAVVIKIIFIVSLITALILNVKNPYIIMLLDIISNIIVIAYIMIKERKTLLTLKPDVQKGIQETKDNILQGSKLMIGIYLYSFLNGICRMFISITYTDAIENFSYYSFAFSITNIVITCIATVGTVLYPHISKEEEETHIKYYNYIERFIDLIKPLTFLIYYFAYPLVLIFLPKYEMSLEYLGWMLMIIVLQAKMSILNNTYYKLLRQENKMIKDNLFSLLQLIIGCIILRDIKLIVIMQVFVFLYRILKTELFFRKTMNNPMKYSILSECSSLIIFAGTLLLPYKYGLVIFIIYCIMYIIKNWTEYINLLKTFFNKK